MRLHRAQLVTRTLKDGNEVVKDSVPLGKVYIIDLDTLQNNINFNLNFEPYFCQTVRAIEGGLLITDLLDIEEGEYELPNNT